MAWRVVTSIGVCTMRFQADSLPAGDGGSEADDGRGEARVLDQRAQRPGDACNVLNSRSLNPQPDCCVVSARPFL